MKFTLAFGEWIKQNEGNRKIVIGRDARVSGEMVNNIVVGSLLSIGIDVVDLGLSRSPCDRPRIPARPDSGMALKIAATRADRSRTTSTPRPMPSRPELE